MILDTTPAIYYLDSISLGDNICALPAIKKAQSYHKDGKYLVAALSYFHPFLKTIVPVDNILDLNNRYSTSVFHARRYSTIEEITRRKGLGNENCAGYHYMHLVDFNFVSLLNMLPNGDADRAFPEYTPIYSEESIRYRFNLPFKYVCIIASSIAPNRTMSGWLINGIVEYCVKSGLTPVLIGRDYDGPNSKTSNSRAVDGVDLTKCRDLLNGTSLEEVAALMKYSLCTVGLDSGLSHLAALARGRVICGYTIVPSWIRKPVVDSYFKALDVESECRHCLHTTIAYSNQINQNLCPLNSYECLDYFTPEHFITEIEILRSTVL